MPNWLVVLPAVGHTQRAVPILRPAYDSDGRPLAKPIEGVTTPDGHLARMRHLMEERGLPRRPGPISGLHGVPGL
jgi:hypothetical protein